MKNGLPLVSVIIPTRPGLAEIQAVNAIRALDYPREKLEVLVARGRQPSVQRNAALQAARGELIYFLDDDARPQPGNLQQAVGHFRRPEVQMVGGPNLCPPDAPPLEQVFAVVLSSWLAFGPSRARYAPVGGLRESSEKELILCNLLARRDTLKELGGFDEALYPNEENALMDEIQKRGGKLLYDPQFIVHRRPRSTVKAFFTMLLTYGRGRAEQFRLHPTLGSALNFAPPLFCVYLLLLPWLNMALSRGAFGTQRDLTSDWIALNLPLWVYFLVLIMQTGWSASQKGVSKSLAALPLVYCANILYGLGFWHGLFTKLKAPGPGPSAAVTVETLPV